jgi:predicted flap endonuclease-1-like 5' DNA nuclease
MADDGRIDHRGGGFPNIGQPALHALRLAGVTRLGQLTAWRASDLLALHGMGPKGGRMLREALAAEGGAFRGDGRG